ncbi:SDR family NAD(P)-dependent oxidoreductase [Aspergillus neoniger CBS 115656]|uniref:3-oxoacyl-reductase n=1 Tax=Aspergillus neoniger (strain CBS 115656) TaxID=1448310 RepID=A0A318YBZ4_ASPNB|nr:3-oxoacyl-reductase [Aspergillus neoniger CBS 115656]PYH31504.1 3-oxoacyl-reductase [Aspergillus neoniger CBS 115656]
MALPACNLLKGKTAAITGGTTGIGRAIALAYITQGCNVAVNHLGLPQDEEHRHSLLDEVKSIQQSGIAAGNILEIPGDVTAPETSINLLDIFVANAGVFKQAEFLQIESSLLDHSVDVNIKGCFYSCQAAARQMVKQGHGGSIIGISSVSALVGGGLQTHYTPTKAAVFSMMQSMAISLGKDRVRCNALMPGTIATQLADHDMKNPTKKAALEARIPLGRIGSPDDMAGPAVFLACEEMSRYVNATGLLADGGMFSNLQ